MPRKRVLIVDDDADQRTIYAKLLGHHGYAVSEAADGEEAVRSAVDSPPDVVLMDAMLPNVDGWKATERLKGHGGTASIPIVMITAHAMKEDRLRSEAAGVDRYLTKPCMPATVLEEVLSLIGPATAED